MNNALNALRAIAAVAPPQPQITKESLETTLNNNFVDQKNKRPHKKQPNSPTYCSSSSSSRLSPCATSNTHFLSASSSTDPLISAASTLQIVSNLANELGANTPIGTILKKANSPNPAISTPHGGGVREALAVCNVSLFFFL